MTPQATPSQQQLLDEMRALVNAWVDRGTPYKDVVPLFATYLAVTAIDGNYSFETITNMFGRLWARTMQAIVEARMKKGIPAPPSKP